MKNIYFFKWVVIGLLVVVGVSVFGLLGDPDPEKLTYDKFNRLLEASQLKELTIIDNKRVEGKYDSGDGLVSFEAVLVPDHGLVEKMIASENLEFKGAITPPNIILSVFISWFPILLIVTIWLIYMKKSSGGSGGLFNFGRSKAKLAGEQDTLFKDVAGCDEAKEDVKEIVEFLSNPDKFSRLGGQIPKGLLMVGPPGTGKTLLAKAIAGEAGVPFYAISGSDFVEMFAGIGASRVRGMFAEAKKNSPSIIFIDEIDGVGGKRGHEMGGHNEREQTLNSLLTEMDGLSPNGDDKDGVSDGCVIVIAATNRPDTLDSALLRPGRFDRQVVVGLPDINGRRQILAVHIKTKGIPIGEGVDIERIARQTPGFSGADLANLLNEAAIWAAKTGREDVSTLCLEKARDKVMMGAERKSMVLTDEQKRVTAYHEAGHAIVAHLSKNSDPIHKVSIIPRGRALGVTMQLPKEDRLNHSEVYLMDQIAILMAGRAAEELVLGELTTGASNDLERATEIARNMVAVWGMSSLGKAVFRDMGGATNSFSVSEKTSREIDLKVIEILDSQYDLATNTLKDNFDVLHSMSKALIEMETLDSEQIIAIVEDKGGHQQGNIA